MICSVPKVTVNYYSLTSPGLASGWLQFKDKVVHDSSRTLTKKLASPTTFIVMLDGQSDSDGRMPQFFFLHKSAMKF